MLNQGVPASNVIQAIEGSVEYRDNQVQQLYQRYLHRAADAGGLQGFVNFLAAGGTVGQVAAILVGSGEYAFWHGTNESFLVGVYEDALDRAADPTGMSNFSQALASGLSRTQAGGIIFGSPEFLDETVEARYQSILGRPSDPGGLSGFVTAMQHGASDQAVLALILGSGESFHNRTGT
jgi:hypothetical protein